MDRDQKERSTSTNAHQSRSGQRDQSPSPQITSPALSDGGHATPSLQTPPISRSVQSYYSELDERRMHEVIKLI